jgi:hypothetical protein
MVTASSMKFHKKDNDKEMGVPQHQDTKET